MNRQIKDLARTTAVTTCALIVTGALLQGCADRRYEYGAGPALAKANTAPTRVAGTEAINQTRIVTPAQTRVVTRTTPTAPAATVTTVPAPPRATTVITTPTAPATSTTTVIVNQPASQQTTGVATRDKTFVDVSPGELKPATNTAVAKTIPSTPALRRNRDGKVLVGASNGSDPVGSILGRPVIAVDVVPSDVAKKLEEYRMGPGDRVQIKVFGQDDISGEFEVSAAGELSYPLIGQISAENRTPGEFNELLTLALEEFFVNPQVTVEITNYRPFFILGQVGNPGSYKYQPGLNARMAIAVGGGYTRRASEEPITIFRSNSAGELIKFDADQDSIILPGDTVEVHRRLF